MPDLMTIFGEALEQTDTVARAAYLDRVCGGDAALRKRVESLIAAHSGAGRFLESEPVSHVTGAFTPDPRAESEQPTITHERMQSIGDVQTVPYDRHGQSMPAGRSSTAEIGTVIAGRYTLVEVIGEGGMGSVYRAEQSDPVKRQVALKLIKSGMDSKTVLARFDAERQALALMDHPNIARIYDGGVTPTGQPFFVMELVQGVPFTEYCDTHRLSVDARLQLFVAVCQAVQHAHQKGIIHRDLKPSNVLVTEVDGRPTPKVIDFGVAKATEQKLTDMSFSDVGAIVGTPAYMSPEQADPTSMDIDTRTDVYALGVILYELLTGATPINAKQFKRGAILEMLRMVREVEPPRPSTRLSEANARPNVAANRSIDPAKLSKLLQGELDWVVMKALEKDRTRRYDTANGLARDIQRYLADEVVEARPPSRGYRLKKFVKRNKGQVIAASLILFALVAGMAGTTLGLHEARRQTENARDQEAEAKKQEAEAVKQAALARDEAAAKELARAEEARQRGVAEAEKKRADEEKSIAQAVKYFLQTKLLAQADTATQANQLLRGGRLAAEAKYNPTIKELLDRAAVELAADKIEANFPGQPLVQAEILRTVGVAYLGIGEAATALPFLTRSADLLRIKLGPDHADTLTGMSNLAIAYLEAGKLDKALPIIEETFKRMKANLGPDHPSTLTSMNNLAGVYWRAGKLDLALPLMEETFKLFKAKLGHNHPDTLTTMNNLAMVYVDTGKLDKALPLFEESFKLMKANPGPDHRDTLTIMHNLAGVYRRAGKLDQALPLLEELLPLQEKTLGRSHPETQTTVGNLGVNYRDADRLKEGIPLLEEAHRAAKKQPELRWVTTELFGAYSLEEPAVNVKRWTALIPSLKTDLGEDHPLTIIAMNNLGYSLARCRYFTEAEPMLKDVIERELRALDTGKDVPPPARTGLEMLLLQTRTNLGEMYQLQRKHEAAEDLLRKCLAEREKKEPKSFRLASTQSMLGRVLAEQKKFAEAESLLLAGYKGLKDNSNTTPGWGKYYISDTLDWLTQLYEAWGKPEEARKWRAEQAKYREVAPIPKVKSK